MSTDIKDLEKMTPKERLADYSQKMIKILEDILATSGPNPPNREAIENRIKELKELDEQTDIQEDSGASG